VTLIASPKSVVNDISGIIERFFHNKPPMQHFGEYLAAPLGLCVSESPRNVAILDMARTRLDRDAEWTRKFATNASYIIEKIRRSNLRWRYMTLAYVVEAALAYDLERKRTDRGHQGRLQQRERALRAQIAQAYEAMQRHPAPSDLVSVDEAAETAEPAAADDLTLREALAGDALDTPAGRAFGEASQRLPSAASSLPRQASTG
jgi:hypothetical protein